MKNRNFSLKNKPKLLESFKMRSLKSHLETNKEEQHYYKQNNRRIRWRVNQIFRKTQSNDQPKVQKSRVKHQQQTVRKTEVDYFFKFKSVMHNDQSMRRQFRSLLKQQPQIFKALEQGRLGELRLSVFQSQELLKKIQNICITHKKAQIQRIFQAVKINLESIKKMGAQQKYSLNDYRFREFPMSSCNVSKLLQRNQEKIGNWLKGLRDQIYIKRIIDYNLKELNKLG